MKSITLENIYNKEKFTCTNRNDVTVIEGIEYLRVFKFGTQKDVLVRKDYLKRINEKR